MCNEDSCVIVIFLYNVIFVYMRRPNPQVVTRPQHNLQDKLYCDMPGYQIARGRFTGFPILLHFCLLHAVMEVVLRILRTLEVRFLSKA